MELNRQQLEGLEIAVARYKAGKRYTVISGYAGTGKTVLVSHIIQALPDIRPADDVCYCAYTGKATEVLHSKGNDNCLTLHKLLYEHMPLPDGSFARVPREKLGCKIVVVDEVSMVPKSLLLQLFKHDIYALLLGDPEQLEPVEKEDENSHILDSPHIFLSEIMRQQADSGIIQLSMMIRQGKNISGFKSKDAMVLPRAALCSEMLEWADVVLCSTNTMRNALNQQMRSLKGFSGETPQDGEKVICLRNYWKNLSDCENPLINGTCGIIHNPRERTYHPPSTTGLVRKIPIINASFVSDTNEKYGFLNMDKNLFTKGEVTLSPEQSYRLSRIRKFSYMVPYEFTFGYALTTWKAQGSEWGKVLIIEEGFPYKKDEKRKFLYTSVTRASEKVVVIQKP